MAAVPRGCAGSSTLGRFRISVRRAAGGAALAIKSVAAIPAGSHLLWDAIHIFPQATDKAEVAAILVPASGGELITLDPRKAATHAEWDLPKSPSVIAVIFGPQGLNMGKVKSLVARDRELLTQLADYAEQTSVVESLVQQLADSEQSGGGAEAALKGFSSRYDVALPKLDSKASTDQQATTLLRVLLPSASAYDPLAPKNAQMQQSGGLAASVAGLFFGNSVGLAAGGAALFQNLKTLMFPATEFRSAFAQTAGKDNLALCTKNQAAKSRTRTAYLWAYRVPNLKAPTVGVAGPVHMPLGSKSSVRLKASDGSKVKNLELARDWRLVPASGGAAVPVSVTIASAPDSIDIDLSKTRLAPGDYRLDATWDWDPLSVSGTVHLHPCGDFGHLRLTPESHDRLVEGNGTVTATLTGADFEFVEKVAVEAATARPSSPLAVQFALPLGKRMGEQDSIDIDIDTAKRGPYRLLLTQSDGVTHRVPVTVLPPNPKVTNLPVRVNLGETSERMRLEGGGIDRIEAVSSGAGEISGAPQQHAWSGQIRLKQGATKGVRFPIVLKVRGLEEPISVPDAIEVVGPRPRIMSMRKSIPADLGIEIREDELAAGTRVGLVLEVKNLDDPDGGQGASRPRVELGCESVGLRHSLALEPNEQVRGANLTFAGAGALYLSIDPSAVGYPGCRLTASVETQPEGRSDPFPLGRVIRIPHLDQFTLTTEKVGPSDYAGILKGRDLDVVEKTGWDAEHGVPVDSIPTPVPGDPPAETLRIALPWPAPAPHAPLYVWLRGEQEGRKTGATY